MKPTLSILIPTYNRANFLSCLLQELECQLLDPSISVLVEVLIADNCSQDDTMGIATLFASRYSNWSYIKRSSNVGPDANMMALLESASGAFCWFIGDDDLPREGLIAQILACLRQSTPSLLYLRSRWAPDISVFNYPPLRAFRVESLSSRQYAAKINIWTTFISSWVFNSETLLASSTALDKIRLGFGTYFVQLGWILPLLDSSGPFLASLDDCIFATSGNTGNYSSLQVFGINYSKQVKRLLSIRSLVNALIDPFLIGFLPRVIVGVKIGTDFSPQMIKAGPEVASNVIKEHFSRPSFYLLCLPIILLPARVVKLLYSFIRLSKLVLKAPMKLLGGKSGACLKR